MNDSRSSREQLDPAHAALGQASAELDARIGRATSRLDELTEARRRYVLDTVQSLLPEVSPRVLNNLREKVPRFVGTSVVEAFMRYRKILGVIRRRGYRRTMVMLHTRLAEHLERHQYGDIPYFDAEWTATQQQLEQLRAQHGEISSLAVAVGNARRDPDRLSDETLSAIGRLVPPAEIRETRRITARREPHFSVSHIDSVTSANDLLLYFFTGIPISARTLVLDLLREDLGHRESPGSSGSAWVSSSTPSDIAAASIGAISGLTDAIGTPVDLGTATDWSSADPSSNVCTPESAAADLGRFS
uniref:hypothetical protein n=1 Tax=Burkholderia arboris TaxID=488730 RepID=UPI003BEF254D